MKNFNLKIVSLFILFLFCLTPLGAVDLDNESCSISDNSTMDESNPVIISDNSSMDESNPVIEEVDQSESVDIDAVSDEKIYQKREIPAILLDIDDYVYGEKLHVNVYASKRYIGITYLTIEGYDKQYRIDVAMGGGNATIDLDLPPGTYTARLICRQNDKWLSREVTDTFTVKDNHINPNLSIKVENTTIGKEPIVEIHSCPQFDRTLNLKLDDSDKIYSVKMVDGYGSIALDDDLNIGNHSVSVRFDGDDDFFPSEASTSFSVRKGSDLSIKVNPQGNYAYVNVYTDKDLFSGLVKVKINNSDNVRTAVIVNGYGTIGFGPLDPGNYTATATFAGNDQYMNDEATANFTIEE